MSTKQPERDIFRPPFEPASKFYDEILKEAKLRKDRGNLEWIELEIIHMHKVATDHANQMGLPVPTLAQIRGAETYACGHVDYAAKWAFQIARIFEKK